uniref:Uncharacterized protein n=1 Tax=Oryza brachyantha TaxID=4533 RepID=J3KU37_ORYBR
MDSKRKDYLGSCEPPGCHNFFRIMKIISFSSDSGLGSASTTVTASQWSALSRSSALQPLLSRSEKTVHAWRRSYVRG